MKEFLQSQLDSGIQVPEAIQIKLTDTRITGFMASPNALAGALLITLPPVFYFGSRWGKMFEPAKVSIALFRGCGVILLGGALILCRSRSVFISLVFAGAIAVFSLTAMGYGGCVSAFTVIACHALLTDLGARVATLPKEGILPHLRICAPVILILLALSRLT